MSTCGRQEANEAIVAELSVLVDASGFVDPEDYERAAQAAYLRERRNASGRGLNRFFPWEIRRCEQCSTTFLELRDAVSRTPFVCVVVRACVCRVVAGAIWRLT